MPRIVLISLFGVAGVLARYLLGQAVGRALPSPFPYGTFVINVSGAFVIGAVYVLGLERSVISPDLRVGIMVGFVGGYTTFSSYCLEIARLLEDAEYWYAALYLGLSNVLGLAATFGGLGLARLLFRRLT
jgi:CrcB protein